MRRVSFAAIILIFLTPSAWALETVCQGHEDNLKTYLEMTDILFNQRQTSRAGEYYADTFISHNVDTGGLVKKVRTPEYMAKVWSRANRTNPDRKVTNELIICQGDLVIARVSATGTLIPDVLRDQPEKGRRYIYSAIDIYRFKDGKVVERWGNNDRVAQIRQTGLDVDLSLKPLPTQID
ncbi:MAG: ester cyclase [Pseudomonadota bacterium]